MKSVETFITFLSFSVSLDFVLGNGYLKSLQFSRYVDGDIIQRKFDVSISNCLKECGLRSSCVTLNYHRKMKLCELLSTEQAAVIKQTWVSLSITEDIRRDVMAKHCGNQDDCPARQKCSKLQDGTPSTFHCTTEECGIPERPIVRMFPTSGHLMYHVGAKVKVIRDKQQPSYDLRCCVDGTWEEECGRVLPSSTTPPITSTATLEWRSVINTAFPRDFGIYNKMPFNWQSAMEECRRQTGTLAHVYDLYDLDVFRIIWSADDLPDEMWLGGRLDENTKEWAWMDVEETNNSLYYHAREPVDLSLWQTGVPPLPDVNTCLYLSKVVYLTAVSSPGYMYSLEAGPCADLKQFMCQRI